MDHAAGTGPRLPARPSAFDHPPRPEAGELPADWCGDTLPPIRVHACSQSCVCWSTWSDARWRCASWIPVEHADLCAQYACYCDIFVSLQTTATASSTPDWQTSGCMRSWRRTNAARPSSACESFVVSLPHHLAIWRPVMHQSIRIVKPVQHTLLLLLLLELVHCLHGDYCSMHPLPDTARCCHEHHADPCCLVVPCSKRLASSGVSEAAANRAVHGLQPTSRLDSLLQISGPSSARLSRSARSLARSASAGAAASGPKPCPLPLRAVASQSDSHLGRCSAQLEQQG